MAEWLQPPLTTLAFCWRLARLDGVTLGFTSHDRDLRVDGLLYRASPGLVPSAIERSADFAADTVELAGVMTSSLIREDDLLAGRWDGAELRLFAVDWTLPNDDIVALTTGTLGGVSVKGGQFSVELRGSDHIMDAPIVEETSPECRAALGDKRCRVDLAGRSVVARFVSEDDARLIFDMALAADVFSAGRLQWLDGANSGLSTLIHDNDATGITLQERPAFPPQAGDRAMLTQGCDRRFSTCTTRFANAANFRGEPHLPGNDLLLRYGG